VGKVCWGVNKNPKQGKLSQTKWEKRKRLKKQPKQQTNKTKFQKKIKVVHET